MTALALPPPGLTVTSSSRPTLEAWMSGAMQGHVLAPFLTSSDPVPGLWMDVLDELLEVIETKAPRRWEGKRRDFRRLRTEQAFLSFRAELLIAATLARSGVPFDFGDTSVSNPDVVLANGLGIEVTAKAPEGVSSLHEELEQVMLDWPESSVSVRFSTYPVRVKAEVRAQLVSRVQGLADQIRRGGEGGTFRIEVDDRANDGLLAIITTVAREPSFGEWHRVTWQVDAGILTPQLAAVERQVLSILRDDQKTKQAQSMPVLLAVDIARLGGGWMRPSRVWAQMLAGAIPASSAFVGIAVMVPYLDKPVPDIALAMAPAASEDDIHKVTEVTEAIGLSPIRYRDSNLPDLFTNQPATYNPPPPNPPSRSWHRKFIAWLRTQFGRGSVSYHLVKRGKDRFPTTQR